jgi:hypothetical protein
VTFIFLGLGDKSAEVVLICRSGEHSFALPHAMTDQVDYVEIETQVAGMNDCIDAGNPEKSNLA